METINAIPKEDGSYLYKYFLRGSRNYVQGKVIFESFCNVLCKSGIASFNVKEVKFQKELYSNGRIIVKAQADKTHVNYDELCALMSITADTKPICIYLLADANSKIDERREDIVNPYINGFRMTGKFESESKLLGIKDFSTLISTMVDINKRTHVETLNDTDKTYKYVWTFLKRFDVFSGVVFSEELRVKIKHLGHKRNERGEGYTLNRINFSLNGKIYKTDMCYTYVKR